MQHDTYAATRLKRSVDRRGVQRTAHILSMLVQVVDVSASQDGDKGKKHKGAMGDIADSTVNKVL